VTASQTGSQAGAPSGPSVAGAGFGRRLGAVLMHGLWRPRVLGTWRVPPAGPVILAVNHSHNIDGPMLLGTAPRPVHFLIKKEAFAGPLGTFLHGIGQLAVDRGSVDRAAISGALGVLDRGGVLGIFPEGTRGEGDFASLRSGLAYFAVRSAAQVVPVAVLGTAGQRGRAVPALPPLHLRSSAGPHRIDVVYGEPFRAGDGSGRRTRAALDEATVVIRKRLGAHLADAKRLTGRP
jgi:1-acyl-sn-glycerol-3-phosphate acyltransferase